MDNQIILNNATIQDYLDIIGSNSPINFRVKATVFSETESKDIILYETVFDPTELTSLPELEE